MKDMDPTKNFFRFFYFIIIFPLYYSNAFFFIYLFSPKYHVFIDNEVVLKIDINNILIKVDFVFWLINREGSIRNRNQNKKMLKVRNAINVKNNFGFLHQIHFSFLI